MTALEVVDIDEAVEVTLDFLGLDAPGPAARDPEAFIAVHAFDEAVGARSADLGGAIRDLMQGKQSSS